MKGMKIFTVRQIIISVLIMSNIALEIRNCENNSNIIYR